METTYLVRPGDPGPIEARVTAPDGEPGQGGRQAALSHAYLQLGYADLWGEQRLGEDSALTYSAVWGCVRVISEAIACLGWHVYERSRDGRSRLPLEDAAAWLIDLQANPETAALDWRQKLLKDALLSGNGYAEIERTGMGKPHWLWQLDRRRVQPDRFRGQLVYEVTNGSGMKNTVLQPRDVYHLKGLSDDGVVGYGVVELARKTIRLGLQEEQFGVSFFEKGPMPGGILKVSQQLTTEAREKLQRDAQKLYGGGSRNAGRILVLMGGQEFSPLDLNNADAQFLESRKFQVTEVCRWFGVPPHKLADLDRATFSNVEEQERAFVTDCLTIWARRLESEADIKLFGPVQTGRRYTKLNLDARLRGNSQTQTSTVTAKVTSGIMTVNEARAYFDLNPIDGGDTPLVQGAMVPLERVLEEPMEEPMPEPAPAPEPVPEPAPDPTDRVEAARVFGRLLEDAIGRLLRVEADKARRAANKGQLAEHCSAYYGAESADHVSGILTPILAGLALALGRPLDGARQQAEEAAARHLDTSRRALLGEGVTALAEWDRKRPQTDAEQILRGVLQWQRN